MSHGHEVYLEKDAGAGSQFADDEYAAAGATIIGHADDVWGTADMVLKVKEPVAEEYHRMRPGLTLFTYVIPSSFLSIPFFRMMADYDLIDTKLALVLAMVTFASPYALWVLSDYARSLPPELEALMRRMHLPTQPLSPRASISTPVA